MTRWWLILWIPLDLIIIFCATLPVTARLIDRFVEGNVYCDEYNGCLDGWFPDHDTTITYYNSYNASIEIKHNNIKLKHKEQYRENCKCGFEFCSDLLQLNFQHDSDAYSLLVETKSPFCVGCMFYKITDTTNIYLSGQKFDSIKIFEPKTEKYKLDKIILAKSFGIIGVEIDDTLFWRKQNNISLPHHPK